MKKFSDYFTEKNESDHTIKVKSEDVKELENRGVIHKNENEYWMSYGPHTKEDEDINGVQKGGKFSDEQKKNILDAKEKKFQIKMIDNAVETDAKLDNDGKNKKILCPTDMDEYQFDHIMPNNNGKSASNSWSNVQVVSKGYNIKKGNKMPNDSEYLYKVTIDNGTSSNSQQINMGPPATHSGSMLGFQQFPADQYWASSSSMGIPSAPGIQYGAPAAQLIPSNSQQYNMLPQQLKRPQQSQGSPASGEPSSKRIKSAK